MRIDLILQQLEYTEEFASVSHDFRYMRLGQLYVTMEEAMEKLHDLPYEERV